MKLTREQKRVKLAEALGWRCQKHVPDEDKHTALMCWIPPGGEEWHPCEPPDFFNDLNACHEALAILTDKQCHTFNSAISNLKPPRRDIKHPFEKWTWGSPADQYAEALGQILNLWEAGE